MSLYISSMRRRLVPFAIFWFLIWPLLSIAMGAAHVLSEVFTSAASTSLAMGGVAAGALHLLPEIMASALVLFLISLALFTLCDPAGDSGWALRLAEAVLAWAGLGAGVALEFPALLRHPVLKPLYGLFVYQVYIVLFLLVSVLALVLGRMRHDGKAAGRYAVAGLAFILIGRGLLALPVDPHRTTAGHGSTVVLALDSVSEAMDLSVLRDFIRDNGGAHYERAISPGLMTNSTWTAILMHRPVHDTGVLLTFQSPDWSRSGFNLRDAARRQGYETWSYFSDQSTAYVGTMAGFDHDHSGPMGWLQFATAAYKNGSIFIPVIAARLPKLPFSSVPRNQAGTYAYDLAAAVRQILDTRAASRPALVIAHLEYLHQNDFPGFSALAPGERRAVLKARLSGIQDFSGHWQYPRVPDDPIGLYPWKVRHLQRVLTGELAASGFLQQPQNRLVLFSDHGIRYSLDNDNFGQPGYYNVPLITFHVPARDLDAPISTLAITELLGFTDSTTPAAEPMVEYANIANMDEYKDAIVTARWQKDGRIDFRPEVTLKYYQALKAYRPYGRPPGYSQPALRDNASVLGAERTAVRGAAD